MLERLVMVVIDPQYELVGLFLFDSKVFRFESKNDRLYFLDGLPGQLYDVQRSLSTKLGRFQFAEVEDEMEIGLLLSLDGEYFDEGRYDLELVVKRSQRRVGDEEAAEFFALFQKLNQIVVDVVGDVHLSERAEFRVKILRQTGTADPSIQQAEVQMIDPVQLARRQFVVVAHQQFEQIVLRRVVTIQLAGVFEDDTSKDDSQIAAVQLPFQLEQFESVLLHRLRRAPVETVAEANLTQAAEGFQIRSLQPTSAGEQLYASELANDL